MFWRDCVALFQGVCSLSSFSSSHDGEGLDGIFVIPKAPNCIVGSPKFLEGLLCNSEQHPRKSAPFLLFSLSHDREVVDGLLPFSLTGFFSYMSFLMFYE